MLKIQDVLRTKSKHIWSISSRETTYKALELLAEKDIGALMVIDDGKLVGIFSERDYARKVTLKGKSSKETPVGELMTKDVYSITPDKSVDECLGLFTAVHCRHMPVFENNQLIGIVTIGDIVNAIINDQQIKINDLEKYITGSEYVAVEDNP
ncbi:MAG: CBS domain-containing protein [Nitrospirae bacterium]|nr:CBS domain-containing protein [Nitrospirota bacterium]